ncbi:hypothetical protein CFAM422_005816 [Trichoderma lentiforme]|uniref:Uncharacterized protein n=1 Tax=Trichoderma lentiforme TaxID=1567552 RepID=A0A9P5CEN8_9HYPO|nr:hypothetical protein CFAM422_005816 [Trichoderma lentiforme]
MSMREAELGASVALAYRRLGLPRLHSMATASATGRGEDCGLPEPFVAAASEVDMPVVDALGRFATAEARV